MIEGLRLRLESLMEERVNRDRAETAFRTPYRLLDRSSRRPGYPESSWNFLGYYLDHCVPSNNKA